MKMDGIDVVVGDKIELEPEQMRVGRVSVLRKDCERPSENGVYEVTVGRWKDPDKDPINGCSFLTAMGLFGVFVFACTAFVLGMAGYIAYRVFFK